MGETLRPSSGGGGDGDDMDAYEAACTLYYMRRKKLDPSAASELSNLMARNNEKRAAMNNIKTLTNEEKDQSSSLSFPPDWLRGSVGQCCSEPLEKKLHNSDVKDNQNRLCMTKAHVRAHFTPLLRAEERPEAGEGVPVAAYDWRGNKYKMRYRVWGDDKNHVLIGGWKNFFHDHRLEAEKDTVTVWMFRHRHTDHLSALITYRRVHNNNASPTCYNNCYE